VGATLPSPEPNAERGSETVRGGEAKISGGEGSVRTGSDGDRPPSGTGARDPGAAPVAPGRPTEVRERLGPHVLVLGSLMAVVGLVTGVLMLQDFRSRSYLYLAFYAIPSNVAISLFPHEPVLVYFGKFANLWIASAAATLGTMVAAYLDHSVFVPVLHLEGLQRYRENRLYRTSIEYFTRWPFATIAAAGFLPVPFWPFKFLSFSVRYPLRRYMAALAIARYPRYFLLAWFGAAVDVPTWVLFGIVLVVFGVYLVNAGPRLWRRARRRRGETIDPGEGYGPDARTEEPRGRGPDSGSDEHDESRTGETA